MILIQERQKFLVDEKGKPKDIVLRERKDAERMIEDFMIAANETVATHAKWMEIPSMYRVHEQPEPKKIREFCQSSESFRLYVSGGYPKCISNAAAKSFKRGERAR